jgi:tetratricopeptide (TPR) repeat protein
MRLTLPILCAALAVALASACGDEEAVLAAPQSSAASANGHLAPYQDELLALALRAARRVPEYPHVKTRSELEERVVVAALRLEEPGRAQTFAEGMKGWRRGAAFGDIAWFHAQRSEREPALALLEEARKEVTKLDLAEQAEQQGFDGDDEAIEGFQVWRRDRVRAKIARTLLTLGEEERAIEFEGELAPSERGIVERARAERMSAEEAKKTLAGLEAIVKAGTLEDIANALTVGTTLAARFHDDTELGPVASATLEAALEKGPAMFRVDMTLALAEALLERGALGKSQECVRSAVTLLEEIPIANEDDLPLRARAIEVRHRAGDAGARKALDALLGRFDALREHIEPMNQPDLLVPIAEAYATLGDRAAAARVYRRAAEQGALNPNAVPRTDDLVRVCCSMARAAVEPDAETWSVLKRTHDGLTDPW